MIRLQWTAVVAAAKDRLDVCSAETRGMHRIRFVLALQLVNEQHAVIEAWLETPKGVRSVMKRQPVTCEVIFDSHSSKMIHIDARLEGRRIITLTMGEDHRLIYARSSLLEDAGFTPGACDPPTARLLQANQDAASA